MASDQPPGQPQPYQPPQYDQQYQPQAYQQQPYQQQPGPYYPMPQQRKRPLGVTILAILEVLGGILLLIGSLGMFAISALLNTPDFMDELNQMGQEIPQFLIDSGPTLFLILGVVLLVFAVVAFILAWGFLKGKKWAWWLGVIFSVLQIISGVFSLITSPTTGILSLAIPVIILIYLMMASTKAWFTQ